MKLLFVCTGNIFRSMSAEYLAKKYIKDNNIKWIQISSAGTVANPENPFSYTIERLKKYWCDASNHKQTKLTEAVLKDKDFVICMAQHHLDKVKELWYEWVLFNFVAYWKNEDLMDEAEYATKYWSYWDLESYVNKTVDYIHDNMERVIKWLDEFKIERKFLIKKLPDNYESLGKYEILQWYLKDSNKNTIRIRQIINKNNIEYFQTLKRWKWLMRKEYEKKISKSLFDKMRKDVWNRYLEKNRYIVPYKWFCIELDEYLGKLKWTYLAEVEFKTPLDAKRFAVPNRFAKDVSWDKKYSNSNLAKK